MFIFSLNLKLVIKLFENPYNMKILHTADWHIGQTFFGYDRSEEY